MPRVSSEQAIAIRDDFYAVHLGSAPVTARDLASDLLDARAEIARLKAATWDEAELAEAVYTAIRNAKLSTVSGYYDFAQVAAKVAVGRKA